MEKFSQKTYDEFRRVSEFITNLQVKLTGYMDRNYPGLLEVSGTSPLVEVSLEDDICFDINLKFTDNTGLFLSMTLAELSTKNVQRNIDKALSRTSREKKGDDIGLGIDKLKFPFSSEFGSYITVNKHLEDFANNIHHLVNKGDYETLTSFRLPEDVGKMNMKWGSMLNKPESLQYLVINLENEKKSRTVYVEIFHDLNTHTEFDVIENGLFLLGFVDDMEGVVEDDTKSDPKIKEVDKKLFSINHRIDILQETISNKLEEILNDQKLVYLDIKERMEKLDKKIDRLFEEML